VKGQLAITADTDLRLCRFFGLSGGFWLRMQTSHDLKLTKQALASVLPAIKPLQQICRIQPWRAAIVQIRPRDLRHIP